MQNKPSSQSAKQPRASEHQRATPSHDVGREIDAKNRVGDDAIVFGGEELGDTVSVRHRDHDERHDEDDEDDDAADDRLSADQRRTGRDLRRLFHSLCGGIPGQYWPQALLDSAGKFNRPSFPSPTRHGK